MKLRFLLLLTCASSSLTFAQSTLTWNTNTPAANWSVNGNWNPSASPAGNDLIFSDAFGESANATTIGNIADNDYTLNSLNYTNTGSSGNFWQVTQIATGRTVTINSASITPPTTILSVGTATASVSSRVAITGPGTLTINEATSNMLVGVATAGQSALLDMSGLSTFNATVALANFGTTRGNGDVTLANINSITAQTVSIGDTASSTGSGTRSDLLLGTTNSLNADTINVGLRYASGSIGFRSGLTNPTVTIRGTAGGGSRADLTIADTATTGIANTQGSITDFTAGEIDGRVDQLLIGRRGDAGASSSYSGTFSMAKGTLDSTSVILGQSAGTGAAANSVTGTVNVSGGTFVAGSISMADNAAGATSVVSNLTISGTGSVIVAGNVTAGTRIGSATNVAANISISGGSFRVEGNLAEGSGGAGVTSTVALSGGLLDMDHGSILVDTFTQTGGTLKDVASFEASASGGLNLQNSSKLAFGIDSGFTTLNLTGSLTLGASSDLTLSLANGFAPGSSYTLVGNDLGDGITGIFGTINGSTFGPGDSFSLTNNLGTFQFVLSYTGGTGNDLIILAVPEPSVAGSIVAGLVLLCLVRRSRRLG